MNWTLKDFSQFRPLKMVFAIWKTLMNLGAKDIGCSKEINWFKARMNQFVIQTDRSFSNTQQIHNHTTLQFHNSTLSKSNSHSSNSKLHSEQNHTQIQIWMRAKRNKITKHKFKTPNTTLHWFQSILRNLIKFPNTSNQYRFENYSECNFNYSVIPRTQNKNTNSAILQQFSQCPNSL